MGVFMTVSAEDVDFWIILVYDFFIIVMRDAHLWDLVGLFSRRLPRPSQVASLCVVSEFVSTLSIVAAVIFEIGMTEISIGRPILTIGFTQEKRWNVVGFFGIIL